MGSLAYNEDRKHLYYAVDGDAYFKVLQAELGQSLSVVDSFESNVNGDAELFVEDADGDGILDVILSNENFGGEQSYIYLLDGVGAISTMYQVDLSVTGINGDWADINGDGIIDHVRPEGLGGVVSSVLFGDLSAPVTPGSNVSALSDLSLATTTAALETIEYIDTALELIQETASRYAAELNRLDYRQSWLERQREESSAAHDQMMSVDYASEMSELARLQILSQMQTAALAQANFSLRAVMELLITR